MSKTPVIPTPEAVQLRTDDPDPEIVGFLDIDGVLNSDVYCKRLAGIQRKSWDEREEEMLDPSKILLLNGLAERAHLKWVLSSSWRLVHSLDRMRQLLTMRGFKGELIDKTPDIGVSPEGVIVQSPERGHEIQAWLNAHPGVRQFVILDDSADMAHLRPYLVRTTWQQGLEPVHVEQAMDLLVRQAMLRPRNPISGRLMKL